VGGNLERSCSLMVPSGGPTELVPVPRCWSGEGRNFGRRGRVGWRTVAGRDRGPGQKLDKIGAAGGSGAVPGAGVGGGRGIPKNKRGTAGGVAAPHRGGDPPRGKEMGGRRETFRANERSAAAAGAQRPRPPWTAPPPLRRFYVVDGGHSARKKPGRVGSLVLGKSAGGRGGRASRTPGSSARSPAQWRFSARAGGGRSPAPKFHHHGRPGCRAAKPPSHRFFANFPVWG